MKKLFRLSVGVIAALTLASCSASFDKLLENGKYKEAESLIKKMRGDKKYECAELLINEYVELEEYDRVVYVYEKCTPEHCSSRDLKYSSYCHGAGADYETNVTDILRKIFMDAGDYDKVWKYSVWESSDDNGYNAEAYYQFMSDVILYLCSNGNKAEASRFLNHYVYWFDTRIDNDSYYSQQKPQFLCETVRGKLQRIIDNY